MTIEIMMISIIGIPRVNAIINAREVSLGLLSESYSIVSVYPGVFAVSIVM